MATILEAIEFAGVDGIDTPGLMNFFRLKGVDEQRRIYRVIKILEREGKIERFSIGGSWIAWRVKK